MSANKSNNHYSPCQIKFAFDVNPESPLAWYEYFGWEDDYDMLNAYCDKHLKSNSLSFNGIDGSGAKLTVIFETYCEPVDFQRVYNEALALLNQFSSFPEYNPDVAVFNFMLETLEEHNVVVYENEPDSKVYFEFNKITHGFGTYQDHQKDIKKRQMAAA